MPSWATLENTFLCKNCCGYFCRQFLEKMATCVGNFWKKWLLYIPAFGHAVNTDEGSFSLCLSLSLSLQKNHSPSQDENFTILNDGRAKR